MKEILELVKNTEQFQKYVEIVRNNLNIEVRPEYMNSEKFKEDCAAVMLENAQIEQDEEGIKINLKNTIGKFYDLKKPADVSGDAVYSATISKNGDDLILKGNINARFTLFNNTMFDDCGICRKIDEPILEEDFINEFKNMASLYSSKTK